MSSGIVNLGGATLDEQPKDGEPMKINGSAMLIAADTEEDAMKIIVDDIYYKSGVWDPKKVRVGPQRALALLEACIEGLVWSLGIFVASSVYIFPHH